MESEILNIEYNIKQMIVRRLNRFNKLFLVAHSLGITEKALYQYRERFNIQQCTKTKQYFIKENTKKV
jgi:hypothetical protein